MDTRRWMRGQETQPTTSDSLERGSAPATIGLAETRATDRRDEDAGRSIGERAQSVTQSLKRTGSYFREQGVQGVLGDVESAIRQYPVQALMIGAAIGYVLSRIRVR